MSELRKVRVQHAERQSDGSIKKEDVDIYTDAEAVTMDGKKLKERVGELIDGRITELIDGAPAELDTLKEISGELQKNQSGVSTILKKLESCATKKDIPKNLSDFAADEKHRTVTDTEKETWNGKVDKDGNKVLSTNDFTNALKEKLDHLTSNNTNHEVTTSNRGYMSAADKKKLDKIESGAEKNAVTSVNGQVGDVKIDVSSVDLSGYAKTRDLKEYAKKSDLKPEVFNWKTMTAVIDQSNSNPLTCITYEDDAKTMEKGSADWDDFFKSQLVLFKDGKEVRDLKDEELNSLTEADGDVMVRFPRKGLNIKTVGDKVYVSMTDNPDNADFKYYAHTRGEERREAFYLGAYLGYEKDGKLRSVTGQKPLENVSITDVRTKSQANGKGYEACGFYQLTFLQAMYVLKYGNLDSQTAIGQGLTSGGQSAKNTTGATNGKGIDFGTTSSSDQIRFQYIEDFYGNRFWAVDGVATDGSCNIFTATDNFNNSRTGYMDTKTKGLDNGGWLKKVFGTSELGFLGKEFSGSQSTYYSDYSNTRSNYFLFFGSNAYNGADAGAFSCDLCYGASERRWNLGGRLMFL